MPTYTIGIVDIVGWFIIQAQRGLMERPVCHAGLIQWLYVDSHMIGSLQFHFVAHAIGRDLLLGQQLNHGQGAQHRLRCRYPETLSPAKGDQIRRVSYTEGSVRESISPGLVPTHVVERHATECLRAAILIHMLCQSHVDNVI